MNDLDENLICEYLNYLKIQSVDDLAKFNNIWKQFFTKIKYKYDKNLIDSKTYNAELIYLNRVKKTIKENYSIFNKYLNGINFEENSDSQTTYRINHDSINNSQNSNSNEDLNTNYSNNPKITYNYSDQSTKYNQRNASDKTKEDSKKSPKKNTTSYTLAASLTYGLIRLWSYLDPGWRIIWILCLVVYCFYLLDSDN